MLLAIDIGNSRITLGVGDASGWRARWHVESNVRRTADEYGLLVDELLRLDGLAAGDIASVALMSVVPPLTQVLVTMCRQRFGHRPLVVEPGVQTGMEVRYNPPSALGSDRLVGAAAARRHYGAPVVVVDFGTAISINVVDRAGRFVGGAIAPGVGVAAEALAVAGARLRHIQLESSEELPLVGRNTEQSMRSGVLYGYSALVEGLLARVERELGAPDQPPPTVVATGGMAALMAPLVPRIDVLAPDLKLDGLRLIHELNR